MILGLSYMIIGVGQIGSPMIAGVLADIGRGVRALAELEGLRKRKAE